MSNTELKPCPFCGGKPVLLKHNDEDYYKVFCECCGARQWTFANRTDRDAIRNWNTRKPMDNIVAELEKKQYQAEKDMELSEDIDEMNNYGGMSMAYKEAIDTVRRGGAE